MYRVHKSGSKVLAIETTLNSYQERENIEEFLSQGEAVLLCEELDDAANFLEIGVEEIEVVEKDD